MQRRRVAVEEEVCDGCCSGAQQRRRWACVGGEGLIGEGGEAAVFVNKGES